ncbi:MAG: azurin [Bacteroidetes bacterium]|nr:azurin [Bacteroidota bacterium]
MKKTIFTFATIALLFSACGGKKTTTENTQDDINTPAENTAPAQNSNEAIIAISAGDDMKYDRTEIKVKEGQTVKLTLTHIGKAPVATMGHNFVLLAQGVSPDNFSREAVNAKDNDYIPKGMEKDVIAHTKTIGGGETASVEFKAPSKGTYDFLCSFPGHFVMMKGKFIVE